MFLSKAYNNKNNDNSFLKKNVFASFAQMVCGTCHAFR